MRGKVIVDRVAAYLTLFMILLQICVYLGSWVVSAIYPESMIRPILGSEGLRWLFSSFIDNISTHVLVWIILCGMAFGLMRNSELLRVAASWKKQTGYEHMALAVVLWELLAIIIILIILAFIPHAILSSAMGTLFPSSFSVGIVPIITISVGLMSITYGCIAGNFRSIESVFNSMVNGITLCAPFIITYMFCMELYSSVLWIFGF